MGGKTLQATGPTSRGHAMEASGSVPIVIEKTDAVTAVSETAIACGTPRAPAAPLVQGQLAIRFDHGEDEQGATDGENPRNEPQAFPDRLPPVRRAGGRRSSVCGAGNAAHLTAWTRPPRRRPVR